MRLLTFNEAERIFRGEFINGEEHPLLGVVANFITGQACGRQDMEPAPATHKV